MQNVPSLIPLFLLVGIIIVLGSPRQLQALRRMLVVFVIATVACVVMGFTAQTALGVVDIAGMFHVRALKRTMQ